MKAAQQPEIITISDDPASDAIASTHLRQPPDQPVQSKTTIFRSHSSLSNEPNTSTLLPISNNNNSGEPPETKKMKE